jgi:hypothetical protein
MSVGKIIIEEEIIWSKTVRTPINSGGTATEGTKYFYIPRPMPNEVPVEKRKPQGRILNYQLDSSERG